MKSWIGLGLLGFGAVLCARSAPFGVEPERAVLRPGVPHELREGEEHEYRLELAPGEVVDATVEQRGIDVSLSLADPGGEVLLSLDSPTGTKGAERLVAIAQTGGAYDLRVRGGQGAGASVLRLGEPRPAGPRDHMHAQAFREYSRGEALRREGATGRLQALVHYGEALRLWKALGAADLQINALYRQRRIFEDLGNLSAAAETWRQAVPLAPTPLDRSLFLSTLSRLCKQLGDLEQARSTAEQALALAPRTGDPEARAAALNNLALVYRAWGENDPALEHFEASLKEWSRAGNHHGRAKTLANYAETLHAIGNSRAAIAPLREALQMQESLGDRGGQAETYRTLGMVYARLGARAIAAIYLEDSRIRTREARNRQSEALTLNETGSNLLNMGRLEEAWAAFQEAGQIARQSGHQDNEAFALAGLGRVLVAQGDGAGALDQFARSERLYTQLGDPNALSIVLYGRALAERSLGRLEDSLDSIERALSLVESFREEVSQSALQAHVIGARTDLYDLKVDLLLRLHERRPGRGYDAKAFAASEWRRARSLLETVKKMGVTLPRDLPREALQRRGALRQHLQELARVKLRSGRQDLPALQAEIQKSLAQWEALSAEIRRQSPAYADATEPKLIGLREVQELLDPETALIAYTVGDERSILWWIEKDSLEVHPLAPRAELEPLATRAYHLLSQPPRKKQQELVQSRLELLSDRLLGPVEDRLPRVRRLVVITDETLEVLPFAALPVPGSGEPLVESHAVVQLPSASLAATLRARRQQRVAPADLIAVLADPVFGISDERFRGRKPGAPERLPGELSRLPHSEREAEAILALAPATGSRRLIGFAANREAAMDPGLARYRYIHFATHGFVDLENPNLSGIQLSRIDPRGVSWEGGGLLPFYEVYNLSFPADLVTLSACRTAFGPQIRGEGMLGMSRSFLYAGASRVLGALWDVDDAAAADLMILFYTGVLRDGKAPSLALQDAQKEMRARGRSFHDWAGFVLQGDWR
jgi:CHAT domain-containing protein